MIYADHNATAPPLPEAVAAVAACLADGWGNPDSRHPHGRRALARLDEARARIAARLGGRDDEITCLSGATEALNLAILGLGRRLLPDRPGIVTCATEHPAVLEPCRRLAAAGARLTVLPVDGEGRLDPDRLAASLDDRTGLVALMLVNHETGVLHDVAAAAALAHRHGALLVCDAVQAVGRVPVDVAALGADALACTGHKLGGPMGAGALWLRRGLGLEAQILGGGQERGRRAGTPNLPGLAGFGAAAAVADPTVWGPHLAELTSRCEAGLRAALPDIRVHGAAAMRAPGTTLVTLPGLRPGWLAALAGVAASGGAACSGGQGSAVLRALGQPESACRNALRLSFGPTTTAAAVDDVVAAVARAARACGA